MVRKRRRRENVLLTLVTPGGYADGAYKIARVLQDKYKKFSVYIPGWCKSAGTLVTIGAHERIIGDYGELGPLDVQLSKRDELWEMSSGLTVDAAMDALQVAAFRMFDHVFMSLKDEYGHQISLKTATDIASYISTRLLRPIYAQVDPLRIGESKREMTVAMDYGKRLAVKVNSLRRKDSLEILVESYSSHGFVIDRAEAEYLLTNVRAPDHRLEKLAELLGADALAPRPDTDSGPAKPVIEFMSDEQPAVPVVKPASKTGKAHAPGSSASAKSAPQRRKVAEPSRNSRSTARAEEDDVLPPGVEPLRRPGSGGAA